MSIYLETYGCTMNKADSEIMKALLTSELSSDFNSADIVILNSCGVKGPTEHKIRKRIKEIGENYKEKKIIVTGCLPLISGLGERVSVLGTNVYDIVEAVERVRRGERVSMVRKEKENKLCYPRVGDTVNALLPIAEGCLGSCTYCAARFARGNLYCYPSESVLETARDFLSKGYKEIQITGQDTGCYSEGLPSLLEKIVRLEGKFRVRVGMMNPNHVLSMREDLLQVYHHEKIYQFLHVPVQSGNDDILRLMGREYTVSDFLEVCMPFRREFPDLYLCTDIIVGFPTETEEQFADTLELVRKIQPDKVNVTRFSPRPGTQASKMPQLPDRIKKDRSRALYRLRMDISFQINRKYVGREFEVLVTERGVNNTMIGRIFNYKPVVCTGRLGEFKMVTITGVRPTYLKAV